MVPEKSARGFSALKGVARVTKSIVRMKGNGPFERETLVRINKGR